MTKLQIAVLVLFFVVVGAYAITKTVGDKPVEQSSSAQQDTYNKMMNNNRRPNRSGHRWTRPPRNIN